MSCKQNRHRLTVPFLACHTDKTATHSAISGMSYRQNSDSQCHFWHDSQCHFWHDSQCHFWHVIQAKQTVTHSAISGRWMSFLVCLQLSDRQHRQKERLQTINKRAAIHFLQMPLGRNSPFGIEEEENKTPPYSTVVWLCFSVNIHQKICLTAYAGRDTGYSSRVH